MNIEKIINMYNIERKTLKEIAEIIGVSKSTIQRIISKNNYVLNKNTKIYEINNDCVHEAIENYSCESINKSSNETINNEMVSGSYTISRDLAKALKFKSIYEDKTVVDILRDALSAYVEEKYYKF